MRPIVGTPKNIKVWAFRCEGQKPMQYGQNMNVLIHTYWYEMSQTKETWDIQVMCVKGLSTFLARS